MTRQLVHHAARIALVLVLASASSAAAQERYAGRSHMELSFTSGWGFSLGEQLAPRTACGSLYCAFGTSAPPTDQWLTLGLDLRVYAPERVGFALRTAIGWGIALLEPGAAYALDLHEGTDGGVRLQVAGGLAVALPFADGGPNSSLEAVGGWVQAGVDLRVGSFFAGLALDARAMVRPSDGVAYGVLTPTLRLGGEWGL